MIAIALVAISGVTIIVGSYIGYQVAKIRRDRRRKDRRMKKKIDARDWSAAWPKGRCLKRVIVVPVRIAARVKIGATSWTAAQNEIVAKKRRHKPSRITPSPNLSPLLGERDEIEKC